MRRARVYGNLFPCMVHQRLLMRLTIETNLRLLMRLTIETNLYKFMQFLMGLNDAYGPVRDQVFGMDSLPSLNKAYLMVLKFESQKEVLRNISSSMDSLVLFNKAQGQFQEKQKKLESKKEHCSYYDMDGHVRKVALI